MKGIWTSLKKYISIFTKEFVLGGHMTALEALAMIFSVILLSDLSPNLVILIIPYLIAQLIYSYNQIREAKFDADTNPERVRHFKNQHKLKLLLFVVYFALLIISLIFTNFNIVMFVIFIVICGFAYTDYFKTLNIRGFKNFYAALFWVLVILTIPFYYHLKITAFYTFSMLVFFLTVFVNTIFFDIKDILGDRQRNIRTYPVIWGVKKTIYVLCLIKLISIVPIIISVYYHFLPYEFIFFIIIVFYGILYITSALYLKGKKLRLFSYIIADAEFILWLLLLLLVKIIL
ncbi:MAG: hypothetical protein US52_C0031G0003 [candidate division WS6 bacterium GW2011_GWA2_37_6]|uniref:UbiA prenyltransferase n=1 Tax=candidate division WS6 bacterium GW2011_GWA2_37_6 TaxID=1619087 RepID=A0A0G0GZ01_9BACT|nr:MAG: hypothetical protein US52_C0031G0003 [candidate division WS6 bacterium GW2011_GWA2_37_6]